MATEEKLFKLYNRRKYKWAGLFLLREEGVEGVMALRGVLYRAIVGGVEGFSSTWKGVD